MNDVKKCKTFPVQAKGGDIYQVTIKSIKADPADRYGWKKDHLVAWLKFDPTVGSVIETGIDLPIREYTREELLAAIVAKAQELINQLLADQKRERQESDIKESHKAELDAYAEKLNTLLES